MIDRESHPVSWTLFVDELTDAHEHLGDLIRDLSESRDYSEEELRVHLGHAYAHLNRAWFRRDVAEDVSESDWHAPSRIPNDLDPVG